MDIMTEFFQFSLTSDDRENTSLGKCVELEEFFNGSLDALSDLADKAASALDGAGVWIRPRLMGLTPSDILKQAWVSGSADARELGDAWLNIHDPNGLIVGSYFTGAVTLESLAHEGTAGTTAVISCWVPSIPARSAGPIWKIWSQHAPASINEWVNIPIGEREGWMEVSRMFGREPGGAKKPAGTFELLGADIEDLASFYCALGEAMNGPGGYYGCNLASLDDCLFGGQGPTAPFRLVWRNSDVAMRSLGALSTYVEGRSAFDLIFECLRRRRVAVELE